MDVVVGYDHFNPSTADSDPAQVHLPSRLYRPDLHRGRERVRYGEHLQQRDLSKHPGKLPVLLQTGLPKKSYPSYGHAGMILFEVGGLTRLNPFNRRPGAQEGIKYSYLITNVLKDYID